MYKRQPPISYIKQSGGLFQDMTIHDFDMARFIMGYEVEEVYATGNCLVDPAIAEAGDIDSANILLKFENGATATIENSREAKYGYDQRLEVLCSEGLLKVENPVKSDVLVSNYSGTAKDRNLDFFMDRYENSYFEEMKSFIEALKSGGEMPVTGEDGIKAMKIAQAANLSMAKNEVVRTPGAAGATVSTEARRNHGGEEKMEG